MAEEKWVLLTLQEIDIAGLDWLNSNLVKGSVPLLQFISGSATYISITMVLTAFVIGLVNRSRETLADAAILAVTLITVALTIHLLKSVIDRDRPFITYSFIEKMSTGGGSSFPSGHTVEAFAMAMAVTTLVRVKWFTVSAFTWALAVAYTRLALGVHYPTDVLCGLSLGILLGWLIPLVMRRFAFRRVHSPLKS